MGGTERGSVLDSFMRNNHSSKKIGSGKHLPAMFAYAYVVEGNITNGLSPPPYISSNAAIRVGEDIQKPDSDVIVYSEDIKNSPIMNFSCKTSCRDVLGKHINGNYSVILPPVDVITKSETITVLQQNTNWSILQYGISRHVL
jgi:hypothetical protein